MPLLLAIPRFVASVRPLPSSDAMNIRRIFVMFLIASSFAKVAAAQTAQCTVSGYLFNPDASPATNASVHAIQVERIGSSLILTPIVLASDSTAAVSFTAPQGSTIWVLATAIGVATSGDVGILIPNDSSASLNLLAQSTQPPVSGIAISSGANPVM